MRDDADRSTVKPRDDARPAQSSADRTHPGAGGRESRWRYAWLTLTAAFGLHVVDEAAHDFLSWYNPIASSMRSALGIPFPPVFAWHVWIAALTVVVLLFAALTPILTPQRPRHRATAYAYAGVHVGNGLLHLVASAATGRLVPGVWSAPVLLVAAVWLLRETRRVGRGARGPASR